MILKSNHKDSEALGERQLDEIEGRRSKELECSFHGLSASGH